MPSNEPGQDTLAPHSYHLVLTNGDERNVTGTLVHVQDGALIIRNAQGAHVVTYAAGSWQYVELERQDDRG